MADTQDTPIPPEWYGFNYLGRPASVSVLGETPTGGAASGVGASPAGGLGGGTPPPGSPTPRLIPPKSTMLRTVQDILSGAQGIQGTTELLTKGQSQPGQQAPDQGIAGAPLQGATTIGGLTAGGIGGIELPGSALLSPAGPIYSSPGFTMTGEAIAKFPEVAGGAAGGAGGGAAGGAAAGGTAAAGTAEGAAAAGGTTGLSGAAGAILPALAPAALESLGVSFMPQPYKGYTEVAQTAFNPGTALMFPDLLANVFQGKFGDIFGGKPPAINFPGSAWSNIQSAVSGAAPPALPVPANATPEQKAAIEKANSMIEGLSTYQGEMPSYLSGKQSAQTWTNAMNQMKSDLESRFGELQSAYPAAYQAFLAASPQVPGGAPPGLQEALGTPAAQLQQAMQAGDYATAKKVLSTYPSDAQIQALMTQYAPQLQQAQSMSQGFLRGEKVPQVSP